MFSVSAEKGRACLWLQNLHIKHAQWEKQKIRRSVINSKVCISACMWPNPSPVIVMKDAIWWLPLVNSCSPATEQLKRTFSRRCFTHLISTVHRGPVCFPLFSLSRAELVWLWDTQWDTCGGTAFAFQKNKKARKKKSGPTPTHDSPVSHSESTQSESEFMAPAIVAPSINIFIKHNINMPPPSAHPHVD